MVRFLHTGRWFPGQVLTDRVAGTRRIEPAVEAAIETAWTDALARPGVYLFDGPMCRVETTAVAGETLRISLSDTGYKIFLGTNMTNPGFAAGFGRDVMANPLGVSTLIRTLDDTLLLGRRNQAVAYYPGRVHPFAGCLEPKDADVFAAVRRELVEELALLPADITELVCLGMVEDEALLQPELVFAAVVGLTVPQVQNRLDAAEHDALFQIPLSTPVAEMLADPRLTPVAEGVLRLWISDVKIAELA